MSSKCEETASSSGSYLGSPLIAVAVSKSDGCTVGARCDVGSSSDSDSDGSGDSSIVAAGSGGG